MDLRWVEHIVMQSSYFLPKQSHKGKYWVNKCYFRSRNKRIFSVVLQEKFSLREKKKEGEEETTGSRKCHQQNYTLSHSKWLKFKKEHNNVVIDPPSDPDFSSILGNGLYTSSPIKRSRYFHLETENSTDSHYLSSIFLVTATDMESERELNFMFILM
uniref:Putative ovule protein n=1 Tax=Solanum chacoense TaxID=4108 RepID=A0A0V0H276_SOLCH